MKVSTSSQWLAAKTRTASHCSTPRYVCMVAAIMSQLPAQNCIYVSLCADAPTDTNAVLLLFLFGIGDDCDCRRVQVGDLQLGAASGRWSLNYIIHHCHNLFLGTLFTGGFFLWECHYIAHAKLHTHAARPAYAHMHMRMHTMQGRVWLRELIGRSRTDLRCLACFTQLPTTWCLPFCCFYHLQFSK